MATGRSIEVTATFNEPLASYSAGTAPWTLANVPSNGTLSSVTVSGSTATLTINEGPGAANTAVGTFTVALAKSASGVRDAAGNQSSFGPTTPLDRAAPILLSAADTNKGGGVDGKAEQGDSLTLTFSEAIAAGSIPGTSNVAMTGGAGGELTMPGILVTTRLNPKNNSEYSTCTLSFNGSSVTPNPTRTTITVTLAAASGGCTALAGQSGNAGISFAPAVSLTDSADIPNPAAPTSPPYKTPNNFKLF